MPRTQSELITSSRSRLDEGTAAFWTDNDIRRWINEALRDIARRAEVIEDTDTSISVVASTQEYTLPTDVARIHQVEYTPSGESVVYTLEYNDYHSMVNVWGTHKTISESTPRLYTIWGPVPTAKIILYPTPAQAGTLKIYYYRLPTELSETNDDDAATTVDCPEGWDDLILDYVEYKALRKDADPRWQEAKMEYEQHLDELYALTRRHTDGVGQWGGAGTSGLPAWLVEDSYGW